ncbi:MAG: DUF1553 domain-containing protein [Verrucomicrobia bacterium]|nr:DUF1553 domain-containing protein [Verrucomicrobiota bacterium]MDA1067638.1 DUF1553 domain-containing protein [Verrucomicrobiota bacterium]
MIRFSKKFLLFPCCLVIGFLVVIEKSASASEEIDHFEKRIRPLFLDNCIQCHGSAKQEGGLRLDSKHGWQAGGASGPVIIPGNAKSSSLVAAIERKNHPTLKLPKDSITDLNIWIQSGAVDPRSGPSNRKALPNYESGKDHWSFKAIRKPVAPKVQNNSWPNGSIDQFILATQEKKGIKPVADATKEELVRRLYYTLIGLPPTPDQIDTFVADTRVNARELLVDELLASPHFGERWGRHWLDVARFAESSGGGRTLLFKDAWRYRDYVIQAFNDDMPYDQMIREQLAGDLLPYESPGQRSRQLTATAFLALGPTNYELQDKQLLRFDVIDEQIDTVGKAFMGMTLGCARCHDHKFDPVPTSDYYAMAGIFKSTRTLYNYTDNVARWVDTPLLLEGVAAEELSKAEASVAKLQLPLNLKKAELKVLTQDSVKPPQPGLPKSTNLIPGLVVDDEAAEHQGEWLFSQYSQNYLGEGYYHDGDKLKGEKTLTFKTTIPVSGSYLVRLAYAEANNRSTKTPVTIGHSKGETTVLVNQRQAPTEYGRFHSLGEYAFEKNEISFVRISNEGTDGHVIADAVQWFLIEDDTSIGSPERTAYLDALKQDIKGLDKELKPLTEMLKARPLAMTVKEDPEPTDSAIRIRGVEKNKGDFVPRGFLQVASLGAVPTIPPNTSGRLELAEWVISPDNPLSSRVMANRIWSWLFGTGIVRSVDNLGTTGELPSHAELLDYLAVRLQENEWSIKAIIKEILLSRTWQLSSNINEEAKKKDPNNRLLTSYPIRRLDAEQLRDAILAVNGNLDLQMFGPNIVGAGEINANSTAAQMIEYNYDFQDNRRSVYTPAFRVQRHELFELFDFGNVNFSLGKRNTSTVALQALYMLNNPFVLEQSKLAAESLLKSVENPSERVDVAYRQTLGRPPTDQERKLISEFLKDGLSTESVTEWASVFQSLFGSFDFRYLN